MSITTQIPGYVSIPEAAQIIGVSDSLVRRWVRDGTLPALMAGEKTRLIRKSRVDSFARMPRKPGPKTG